MKNLTFEIGKICIGVLGSLVAGFYGGWTSAMSTLCILMTLDFITGLLVAARNRSPKSETGGINSEVIWTGVAKKVVIAALVGVGHRVDLVMGTSYLKDAVCVAYIVNELVSLGENAGLLGVPLPAPLISAIDVLKNKKEE